MSFRQDVLAALASIRSIPGPTGLDLRVTSVTVRTRVWTSGRRGVVVGSPPGYVDTDLVVTPRPKVRKVTLREVNASGGKFDLDDVVVDHIQPQTPGGIGFTRAQIAPEETVDGTEIIYVLASEDSQGFNGFFRRKYAASDRPFRHTLVLTRGLDTPGNL